MWCLSSTRGARALGRLLARDGGQGMVEYGLVIALIALVAALGVGMFGNTMRDVLYSDLVTGLNVLGT